MYAALPLLRWMPVHRRGALPRSFHTVFQGGQGECLALLWADDAGVDDAGALPNRLEMKPVGS